MWTLRRRCVDRQRKHDERGSMLVEVLVGSSILIMLFTAVVQQMSNLATTRVRIETRDRAVAYVNSLHQVMSASGCGFDVDTVDEKLFTDASGNIIDPSNDSFSGSDQVSLQGPWDHVQGCAFSALERARDDAHRVNSYVDQEGDVHLTVKDNGDVAADPIDKDTAQKFCNAYGDTGKFSTHACELGDQNFTHDMVVNDEGSTTALDVKINYWYEKVGATNGVQTATLNVKSSCNNIVAANMMPDTLARRITVSFPDGNGGKETMTVTKRESVPVDSFQFASGTRVGVVSLTGNSVAMYPNQTAQDPWKVTRERMSSSSCIWFPYLSTHDATDEQPGFSVDGGGIMQAALSDIPALSTRSL